MAATRRFQGVGATAGRVVEAVTFDLEVVDATSLEAYAA
jgi:hypothetical protein